VQEVCRETDGQFKWKVLCIDDKSAGAGSVGMAYTPPKAFAVYRRERSSAVPLLPMPHVASIYNAPGPQAEALVLCAFTE